MPSLHNYRIVERRIPTRFLEGLKLQTHVRRSHDNLIVVISLVSSALAREFVRLAAGKLFKRREAKRGVTFGISRVDQRCLRIVVVFASIS